MVKRYNIYYSKYNIIANDYVRYLKVVETNDVYHEIGKMICTSLEAIKNISYVEQKNSREELEKLMQKSGFKQIDKNHWVKEQKQ